MIHSNQPVGQVTLIFSLLCCGCSNVAEPAHVSEPATVDAQVDVQAVIEVNEVDVVDAEAGAIMDAGAAVEVQEDVAAAVDATVNVGTADVQLLDCKTNNPCLEAIIVDGQCKIQERPDRPDCCSVGTNVKCNDYNICTFDYCPLNTKDGWATCIHSFSSLESQSCCGGLKDDCYFESTTCKPCVFSGCTCTCQYTPNCCKVTLDCDDLNSCTTDLCTDNQCSNQAIPGCK